MKTLNSQRGSGLILCLIAMAVIAVMFSAALTTMQTRHTQITGARFKSNLFQVRQSLMATLADQNSWNKAMQNNPSMQCLTTHSCANGVTTNNTQPDPQQLAAQKKPASLEALPAPKKAPVAPAQAQSNLALYNSQGVKIYDAMNPSAGFDLDGKACSTFSAAGNDACPLRADINWTPSCWNATNPGGCRNPEEIINIKFTFAPATWPQGFALNPSNYEINLPRLYMGSDTPLLRCAQNQSVYIGNFPGQPNSAFGVNTDAAGCVPVSAFQGKPGNQGLAGIPGARGPIGPVGPAGGAAPVLIKPVVITQPSCTADPNICALYQAVLGRLPEQTGAVFWQTMLVYKQSLGLTYNEALAYVAEGIANSPEANLRYGLATYTPEQLAAGIAYYQSFAAAAGTTGATCFDTVACSSTAVQALIAANLTL